MLDARSDAVGKIEVLNASIEDFVEWTLKQVATFHARVGRVVRALGLAHPGELPHNSCLHLQPPIVAWDLPLLSRSHATMGKHADKRLQHAQAHGWPASCQLTVKACM